MNRFIAILVFCFVLAIELSGQWCCIDTNLVIKDNLTQSLRLQISGAINNDLATTSQGLCGVRIKFDHKFIGDLTINLTSPSGQTIGLIGPVGDSGFTFFSKWNVTFVPCAQKAVPDVGFKAKWDNLQFWGILGQFFNGTYYPNKGCLEDFDLGSVNGTWTLTLIDNDKGYEGNIESFCLLFCDNSGISCNTCSPNGGYFDQTSISYCENSPDLNLLIRPIQPSFIPDSTIYAYEFLISSGDLINQKTNSLDFRNYPPGNYEICAISYLKADSLKIPKGGQGTKLSEFKNDLAANRSGTCAELSKNCIDLKINKVPPTLDFNAFICRGDSFILDSISYFLEGIYSIKYTSQDACDSIVNLNLKFVDLKAQIVNPLPEINCLNPVVTLDVSGSTLPPGTEIKWTTPDGQFSDLSDLLRPKINKAGTYKVLLTKGQCADSLEFSIAKTGTPPELQVTTDTLNCLKSSIVAKANTNVINPFWVWRDNLGNVLRNSDTLTIDKPGIYSVQVTDQSGCSNLQIINILEDKTRPVINPLATTITCRMDSSLLTFTSSDSILKYSWSGPSMVYNSGLINYVKIPGLYKLEATGKNGCVAEEFVQVKEAINIPDFKYDVDTLTCSDSLVRIIPIINSPLELIEFSGPDSFITNEFAPWVNKSGIYKVKIIDTAGCTLDTFLIVPENKEAPEFSLLGEELNCGEDSIQIMLNHTNFPLQAFQYSWDGPIGFISNQQNPWVRQKGNYKVIVTAPNGCVSEDTITIFEDKNRPVIDLTAPEINCRDTSINIQSNSATAVQFNWRGPSNFISSQKNPPITQGGIYMVTVTSANGCTSEKSIEVIENKRLGIGNVRGDTINCNRDSSFIFVQTVVQIDTFEWSGPLNFSSSTLEPTVGIGGWYYLFARAINGCISRDSVFVVEDTMKPAILLEADSITCDKAFANIITTVNDSIADFIWVLPTMDTSRTQNLRTNLEGIHTLYVTSSNGCSNSKEIFIQSSKDKPILNLMSDTITCKSNAAFIRNSSSSATDRYLWERPDKSIDTNKIITTDITGWHLVTVTNSLGCINVDSIFVVSNVVKPSISFSDTFFNCKNVQNACLKILSTSTLDSIDWTNPMGVKSSGNEICNPLSGFYKVTVSDEFGCKNSDSVFVKYDTNFSIISFSLDTINCKVSHATLNLITQDSVSKIDWFGASNVIPVSRNKYEFGLPGRYLARIEGVNFCTLDTFFDVRADTSNPIFILTADTINCSQPRAMLKVVSIDSNLNFNWTFPDGTQYFGNPVTALEGGIHFVKVTSQRNYCSGFDSVRVVVDTIHPDVFAVDASLPCNSDSIQLKVSSNCSDPIFIWTGPNRFFASEQNPFAKDTGTYNVFVICKNKCSAQTSIKLDNVKTFPNFIVSGGAINCLQDSLQLKLQIQSQDSLISWIGPSQFFSKTSEPFVNIPGAYTVSVINLDGCRKDSTVFVSMDTLKPDFTIFQLDSFKCNQRQVRLLGLVNDSVSVFEYLWSSINGRIVSINNVNTVLIESEGEYELEVKNKLNGCVSTRKFVVNEASRSLDGVEVVIDGPSCFGIEDGKILVKNVLGGKPPYSVSLDGLNFNLNTEFRNLRPGNQRIYIKDAFGCTYDTLVTIVEKPELSLKVFKDTTILLGQTAFITGFTNVDTNLAKKIEWMPSESIFCPNCIETYAKPLKTTRYRLHIIDENGCEISDDLTISVITEPRIFIPDVFSPNGDKINDQVNLVTGEDILKVKKYEIYDRWGNKVFGAYDYDPKQVELGWDGTLNGQAVNPGVFVYLIEALSVNGSSVYKKGSLTLVR
ncbi:MAG: gliding motility-associated C-terminal domain-containing protein [Saprospiraceae bacterium]|nr:gliding motility-associated C-terminal domain-containing protein [Candidatus Vicinibacter affinis]